VAPFFKNFKFDKFSDYGRLKSLEGLITSNFYWEMNKVFIKILIVSIAVFGAGVLFTPSTFAQAKDLEVQFEPDPLFTEANFLPGQKATGTARVTNNTFQPQDIAVEAINYPGFPNPNNVPTGDLSRALSIIIREKGGSDLYGGTTGEKTLFDFYKKVGFNSIYEHVLTYNLPGYGGTTTYEFVINFPSEKENKWQAATTTFDILIGFQGKEDGPPPLPATRWTGFATGFNYFGRIGESNYHRNQRHYYLDNKLFLHQSSYLRHFIREV